jgi:hypothetical protein
MARAVANGTVLPAWDGTQASYTKMQTASLGQLEEAHMRVSTIARRTFTSIIAASAMAIAIPQASRAQSDPLIGTWHQNRAKSTFNPGPVPQNQNIPTVTFQPERQGLKLVNEGTKTVAMIIYDGQPQQTDQEYAEVCYVPCWAGYSKKRADYRFLAIREPLRQLDLGDTENLPFPTQAFGQKGTFKLFGVVTNRKGPGDQVIWWLRERCGKSEEVHSVLKSDLAGGQLPSGLFGANAAWWTLAILSLNPNAAMKQLVLGKDWIAKRMKAVRFHLIGLPGRVVSHARKLIVRLGGGAGAMETFIAARQTIRALACGPAG